MRAKYLGYGMCQWRKGRRREEKMGRLARKGVTVCFILVVERSEFLCASEPGSLLSAQQGRSQPDNTLALRMGRGVLK